MRKLSNILVTGGAGFIGVNFIRYLLGYSSIKPAFKGRIINLDSLTYAGNLFSLKQVEEEYLGTRYFFEHGDICDKAFVNNIFSKYSIDTVIHFAAESHVDRSILGPEEFIKTNVLGTFVLLECAKNAWENIEGTLFHHISTDEVYGSLGFDGYFKESTPYNPRSPYSASKASSDHFVMAYHHTFGVPVTLSNCSNNYGPYQSPEKLIPLMITNMINKKPLPVYGNGKNIRDWIYVDDHNEAVWQIINKGILGEKYNIGGENEWENIKLLNLLISIVSKKANIDIDSIFSTISYIKDRPGHDLRYAIDCSKIKKELGWIQRINFEEGLNKTVDWFLNNPDWIKSTQSSEYNKWINKNYKDR